MSQVEADALTAEVVAEYLKDHPDFFVERSELVDRLSFPHSDLGTVSLVHIQMNRQRQRIEELEEEITTLMSLAANNDRTFYEFMDLQGSILKCGDFKQVISAIELKAKDLGLRAYVRLFSQCDASTQLSKEHYQRFSTNHLNGKEAYLGRLRKVDREALFGNMDVPEMGSYVVLPLVKKQTLGVLAFSSEDGGHFQPDMDTLFLRHLSLVVAHLAQTLVWQSYDDDNSQHSSAK
ncbi:DUF484 family protein [Vibrio parahaemolyticus]|uniref:3',5'-cyclic-nucleotide phosphodiesterase n=1 Tax=Vibrio parahaemolyticus TaxID=670 RepID=A0A249WAC6_VIBPH|nr:DUF484 family protein [Vibrio parahaemolyticus]EQL83390.1 hypothetical protein D052_4612 [Vibrio parahaemolyticus 10290]ESV66238.1 hypothetical protein D021_4632 [Vibrio parahaemolyticus 10296]ESW41991.1 hypothetical protein D022_4601 [Vibrio parahaemolyticus 12310]ETT17047.1 hypothetical protein D023_4491 [Vibrio parahaemolyticus 3256]ETX50705.1 hypothetical protein D020_4538 [Vibrio parahaemolyticus SBR10290]OQT03970.1 3',5'-cyclic-nucleotide phosphodiesterase [Vibrio parahaemolyticus O4